MCGICGIVYSDSARPVDRAGLAVMRDTLAHRGPDGVGLWTTDGVGLGHRRLSIIDLEGGAQPLSNEDESIWVTFNGEIYNYQSLTTELLKLGHRFRTRSDTEVLVHAYEEYGPAFVTRLNGMFAFGIYDRNRRRLVIARDHLGVKPLFYSVTSDGLLFASEIKAIGSQLSSSLQTSRSALQEYLIFRYNAWDRTFFDNIRRLPPAHVGVYEDGRLTLRRYWSPPVGVATTIGSMDEAVEQLDAHLDRVVEAQMISEVPLGSFCSGGVDSGLVSSYAARHSPHRLKTFSVGFEEPAWDESQLAQDTSRRVGTEHYRVAARADVIQQLLPALTLCNDEPLSQPNSAPIYLLSELARRHVTVVLTGEGADEVFCGYPRFQMARIRGALKWLPLSALRGLGAAGRMLPDHRLRRLGELLPQSLREGILLNSAFVAPALVAQLTSAPVDEALEHRRRLVEECFDPSDPLGSVSRYDTVTYLPSLLERMDRMSMAHGLEGRVPFLDVPLVEWGLQLPVRLRTPRGRSKLVVKRLAERFLSRRITGGRKSGFGLPLAYWFRSQRFEWIVTKLIDSERSPASLMDNRLLAELVRRHVAGTSDYSDLMWVAGGYLIWQELAARGASETGT